MIIILYVCVYVYDEDKGLEAGQVTMDLSLQFSSHTPKYETVSVKYLLCIHYR
jgi:hypothetical protein